MTGKPEGIEHAWLVVNRECESNGDLESRWKYFCRKAADFAESATRRNVHVNVANATGRRVISCLFESH